MTVGDTEILALADLDGEPRIRDLELAERLGFERPRDIRKLIERNQSEVKAMGVCATVAQTSEVALPQTWELNAAPSPPQHPCDACAETFSVPVWECRHCGHHWPMSRDRCWNCYEDREVS